MINYLNLIRSRLAIICLAAWTRSAAADGPPAGKPVFLYSRWFNAAGESRYLPDGTYKDILDRLRGEFEVRVSDARLTAESLAGVNVVLVANPSDKAVGGNPPPNHVSAADIQTLTRFVSGGGGFIVMGNQENHNLETQDMNRLLVRFGLQFTNLYTDVKKLEVPKGAPIIGGLRWAYYTGNLLTIQSDHKSRPRALVLNDINQKPLKGERNQDGALMAIAEPGRGHVVAVTDAGWISNDALSEKGIGGVAITNEDNWEIFRRLAHWAAGAP